MKQLLASAMIACISPVAIAAEYLCEDNAKGNLDMFGAKNSSVKDNNFTRQNWVVDTNKGWRRSDNTVYRGSCKTDKGYTVCKADTTFGEAIFSIHPDDSNFILVYLDYGLDLLAFTGNCKKSQSQKPVTMLNY
ncbi:MAG: hypothetical protein P8K27_01215 [Gammaproteobacteria bacterium]|nr:hypothetical protein [Gammaproteobacteria bacterium]